MNSLCVHLMEFACNGGPSGTPVPTISCPKICEIELGIVMEEDLCFFVVLKLYTTKAPLCKGGCRRRRLGDCGGVGFVVPL